MPVEVANGVAENISIPNGELKSQNPNGGAKKLRETERRRRRRKQKKNKQSAAAGDDSDTAADDGNGVSNDSSKESSDPQKALGAVEVEYVPERAESDGMLDEEFRKVFEKFNFMENAAVEENERKDDAAPDIASKKKADSDSEEEEQDSQLKEKGISNKKKKLQRRMKIAELKQICTRPDVVEVWDATAADPKLLVYLKSYRNTVVVPRHWCQKRKFLQESCGGTCGAFTWKERYRETAFPAS